MAAILYTLLFMLGGVMVIRFQLPRKSPVIRVYLGAALGLLLQMQLPALCAYLFDFSLAAHAAGFPFLQHPTLFYEHLIHHHYEDYFPHYSF